MIVDVSASADPRFAKLCATSEGSLFTSPPWIRVLERTYGFDIRARMVLNVEGEPIAAVTYAQIDDPRGSQIVSLPFCDYADPFGDPSHWPALRDSLIVHDKPITIRCARYHFACDNDVLVKRSELARHENRLNGGYASIVPLFDNTVMQNVRRSERSGVKVRYSTSGEDVERFYLLHERTRRHKYGLLAQPLLLFHHILEEFSGACFIGIAELDGLAIAGALYLRWNDVLYYKFGASLVEHLKVRPNEPLATGALELASELGLRAFDWGVSDLQQPGLVSFKRKFGPVESRVNVFGYIPPDTRAEPKATEFARVLGSLTKVLTASNVPDDVYRSAGELLYRYFC
jgi:Acetyltransferase (GNAT) domain